MKFFEKQYLKQLERNQSLTVHNDLVVSVKLDEESKKRKIDKSFKETEKEKFTRLAKEY